MNLFTIAYKTIRQRSLSSALTALSVSLGIMLMVAVLVFHGIIERAFGQNTIGYDLVVGPKGSDLQLVLSSIYRISPPIENVPYLYFEELKKDPRVKVAIPIALGDTSEQGNFPIVGTNQDYFTTPYAPPDTPNGEWKKFRIRFKEGYDNLKEDYDAIVGSEVAETNGWEIGSTFRLIHGGAESSFEPHVHEELFTVIGIMKKTGTPNDKTVFVNLPGFFDIAGHEKTPGEMRRRIEDFFGKMSDEKWDDLRREPDALKEVTAIFIVAQRPPDDLTGTEESAAFDLQVELNKGYKARAVSPIQPITKLKNDFIGPIRTAGLALIVLTIIVSGVSIFVSIYNSMSDRKKEIAIMRALGARRQTVLSIIIAESIVLCLIGGAVGMLLGHGLVFIAAPIVADKTGLLINPLAFETAELLLLPSLVVMAIIAGLPPGLTAYRADVASTLAD